MGYKMFEMQHQHREGNKVESSLPTGDKDTQRESSEHYKACLIRQEHCYYGHPTDFNQKKK